MKPAPKDRLNLVLPPKTKTLLETLQVRTRSGTVTETIRRAIALLDALSGELEKGGQVYVHRPDGTEVPVIFVV